MTASQSQELSAVTRVDLAGKQGKWPRTEEKGQADETKPVWNNT